MTYAKKEGAHLENLLRCHPVLHTEVCAFCEAQELCYWTHMIFGKKVRTLGQCDLEFQAMKEEKLVDSYIRTLLYAS